MITVIIFPYVYFQRLNTIGFDMALTALFRSSDFFSNIFHSWLSNDEGSSSHNVQGKIFGFGRTELFPLFASSHDSLATNASSASIKHFAMALSVTRIAGFNFAKKTFNLKTSDGWSFLSFLASFLATHFFFSVWCRNSYRIQARHVSSAWFIAKALLLTFLRTYNNNGNTKSSEHVILEKEPS